MFYLGSNGLAEAKLTQVRLILDNLVSLRLSQLSIPSSLFFILLLHSTILIDSADNCWFVFFLGSDWIIL